MSLPAQIGRYEIKSELGRGGMAIVYRAYDPLFKREVAIKVLPQYYLHEPGFGRRFAAEAQLVAQLEHVAIVPVYDFGGAGAETDAQPYLVMRYLQGGSLRDRLLKEGAFPLAEAYRIIKHLAPGLDKAHNRGIIHRDLKPDNILFDEDSQPYLVDFGIARLTEATKTMTIIGTPSYMSPEQWEGVSDLDGRCDIYALGAILFEMVTGNSPFSADTPASLMRQHLLAPVPDSLQQRPDLPPAVQAVIERSMAKDRDRRYPNAAALTGALRGALRGVSPEVGLDTLEFDAAFAAEDGRAPQTLVDSAGLQTITPEEDLAAPHVAGPQQAGEETYDSQVIFEEMQAGAQASVPQKTALLEYDHASSAGPQGPAAPLPAAGTPVPAPERALERGKNVVPLWGWGLLVVVLLAAFIFRGNIFGTPAAGDESSAESPLAQNEAGSAPAESAASAGPTQTAAPIATAVETAVTTPTLAAAEPTLVPTAVPVPSDTFVLYILNASNTMMAADGVAFNIAREGLAGHMLALQERADSPNVGLMAFGHLVNPVAGGCDSDNVQLVAGIAVDSLGAINAEIPALFAVGRAPLKEALRAAYQHFSFTENRKNAIILITNSSDGCDQNPLETIRINQENANQRLPIFIAGINVPASEEAALRDIAQESTNGSYRPVGSTADLMEALAAFVNSIE